MRTSLFKFSMAHDRARRLRNLTLIVTGVAVLLYVAVRAAYLMGMFG